MKRIARNKQAYWTLIKLGCWIKDDEKSILFASHENTFFDARRIHTDAQKNENKKFSVVLMNTKFQWIKYYIEVSWIYEASVVSKNAFRCINKCYVESKDMENILIYLFFAHVA